MITTQEARKDSISEQVFARREAEVMSQRSNLAAQVRLLDKRAKELRAELIALDPQDEAAIELTDMLENIVEDIAWVRYGIYQLAADALAVVDDDGDADYRYTAADVKAWCERALEMGAVHPQIGAAQLSDLIRLRQVPNAPFRKRADEVLASGSSLAAITLAVWGELRKLEVRDGENYGSKHLVNSSGVPQNRILERILGTQTVGIRPGQVGLRLFITYQQGEALMRALNMTPQEAGL